MKYPLKCAPALMGGKMGKFGDNDTQELKDIVRIGTVSSVNKDNLTARVKIEEQGIVSYDLKCIQNTPLITFERTTDGSKWSYDATYKQFDRQLGLGESYGKQYPDTINTGFTYACDHAHTQETVMKVYPWLPHVGQQVVCLFMPSGDGDGFILGGID